MEELGLKQQVFLFDLDGTLVNSLPQIMKAANAARTDLGGPVRDEHFYGARIGLPAKLLFEDLCLTQKVEDGIIELFRSELRKNKMSPSDLISGVSQLLFTLNKRGHFLAVATNKPTDLAKKVLCETGIAEFFDCVVGIDGCIAKPDPSILFQCLLSLNSDPSQSFMVGDRPEDMIAAVEAGIFGIGVAQSYHSETELVTAGAKLTFPDILSFSKGIGGSLENF